MQSKAALGRVALITGATAGIGLATAHVLAESGFQLALMGRRPERLQELERTFPGCLAISGDVKLREDNERAVRAVEARFGRLDILVNNAGLARGVDPIEKARDQDWVEMWETNVLGLLRLTQLSLPLLKEAAHAGHIVNLGSIAGHRAYAGGAGYCGSKFAVAAISEILRQELLGSGVRVSEIDPGMVETEFSQVRFRGDTARAKAVYEGMTPLSARDIAEIIGFVVTRPAHVCLDRVFVNPTDQAGLQVHRRS